VPLWHFIVMEGSLIYQIILLVLLLVVSALFSAAETGFTSSSSGKFYKLKRTKKINRIIALLDKKEDLISFTLFGNNAVNIFASAFATGVVLQYFDSRGISSEYAIEISATIMTFAILIFSEITPKTIAIRNPERIVLLFADVYFILLKIFKPFIWLINIITNVTLKIFGPSEANQGEVITVKDTLRGEIEFYHSKGGVVKRDKDMLGGVLDLSETRLHAVLTHRKNVEMLDVSEFSIKDIKDKFVKSNHTRLPVYDGDPDKVIGILHFRDFFNLQSYTPDASIDDIKSILLNPQYASSETTLLVQLMEFKRTKNHMAIVVDEYGDMAGIVTLEDIVEEIVGDIQDEHDDNEDINTDIQVQENGEIIVAGDVLIRDFVRKTGIHIEHIPGVSTMAGLVIHEMHKIPTKGAMHTLYNIHFEVLEVDVHRITKIKVVKNLESH
jgi:Mg2+/Co2+ transporter CorB